MSTLSPYIRMPTKLKQNGCAASVTSHLVSPLHMMLYLRPIFSHFVFLLVSILFYQSEVELRKYAEFDLTYHEVMYKIKTLTLSGWTTQRVFRVSLSYMVLIKMLIINISFY